MHILVMKCSWNLYPFDIIPLCNHTTFDSTNSAVSSIDLFCVWHHESYMDMDIRVYMTHDTDVQYQCYRCVCQFPLHFNSIT